MAQFAGCDVVMADADHEFELQFDRLYNICSMSWLYSVAMEYMEYTE